jgi:hypothetical protein
MAVVIGERLKLVSERRGPRGSIKAAGSDKTVTHLKRKPPFPSLFPHFTLLGSLAIRMPLYEPPRKP